MRRILLLVTAVITVLALSGIKAEAKSEKASVMSFNIRIQFPADGIVKIHLAPGGGWVARITR